MLALNGVPVDFLHFGFRRPWPSSNLHSEVYVCGLVFLPSSDFYAHDFAGLRLLGLTVSSFRQLIMYKR